MNFMFILLVKNIFCASNSIYIKEVLFLENNYWGEDGIQVETDEGFLNSVIISMDGFDDDYRRDNLCSPSNCYYDFFKKRFYYALDQSITNLILSDADPNSEKQGYLNFQYFYTPSRMAESSLRFFKGKINHYKNNKVLIKGTQDTIQLKGKGLDAHLCYIKQMLTELFHWKYVILELFDKIFTEGYAERTPRFTLLHFNSLSACLESFRTFVRFVNCLKLEKYDFNLNSQETSINNNVSNKLNCSYLEQYLQSRFKTDYKEKRRSNLRIHISYQMIESLFKKCCTELTKELIFRNIILPVRNHFTVDYYLEMFYEFIRDTIEFMLNDTDQNDLDDGNIYSKYRLIFTKQVSNMYKTIINEIWDSLDLRKYFSELLGKEIIKLEDYIDVEKIICDYCNMMHCAFAIKNRIYDDSNLNINKPMLIDNFDTKIIRAIEITLKNPIDFGEIRAYDFGGKRIPIMWRGFDFFVGIQKNYVVSMTFEKIREKNINEIEIISADGQNSQTFIVCGYLNDYKSWWNRLKC